MRGAERTCQMRERACDVHRRVLHHAAHAALEVALDDAVGQPETGPRGEVEGAVARRGPQKGSQLRVIGAAPRDEEEVVEPEAVARGVERVLEEARRDLDHALVVGGAQRQRGGAWGGACAVALHTSGARGLAAAPCTAGSEHAEMSPCSGACNITLVPLARRAPTWGHKPRLCRSAGMAARGVRARHTRSERVLGPNASSGAFGPSESVESACRSKCCVSWMWGAASDSRAALSSARVPTGVTWALPHRGAARTRSAHSTDASGAGGIGLLVPRGRESLRLQQGMVALASASALDPPQWPAASK